MMPMKKCILLFLLLTAAVVRAEKDRKKDVETITDLEASPTSAKFFNLGSLFGQTPNYPNYGYGSYLPNTNYNRPQYSTAGGYYPSTSYPTTSWTGTQYYPTQGYYGGNTGSYYPSTGSNYPATNGYYPTGTNILGSNGGYGGYGGYRQKSVFGGYQY